MLLCAFVDTHSTVNGGQCACSQLRLNDALFAFLFQLSYYKQVSFTVVKCCISLKHSFEELASEG